ncbi:hypothetical protein PC110_g11571 [Phytophthora cactorum]|uniref:Peptidase S59 domain-containing protein n=1 Tax=Phytophthora cactorum TaxID=29920 RepID=A0A329S6E8_9STRA|nr:hypothetical protein PC110_g11571 [Phytophthora cactorum]
MSLFASTINPAPAANGSITFGPPATSGFGGPVTAGFGFGSARSGGFGNASSGSNVVSSAMWADNASEPFGRVESTRRCFARNGKVAATSEWTPPKPPSRPLFQSSSGFHSSSRERVPLFGQSTQSTTLFGASGSNSSGNEATVGGGGFTFGFAAPATKTDALFGTANAGFGGDVGQETTTTLFGNTDNVSESRVDPGFVATRKAFGNSGGSLEASRENSGFGETRTVFGSGSSTAKPPLAPSWNPFASSTKQVGISSNPFAPTSPSTSNPFTFTPPPRSTGNPLATKMSANASVNPFVTKVSANTTVNPFAVKASSNASVNPFAVKTPSNVTVESVRDTPKKLSSVPGSSSSVEFKSGLHPAFNIDSSPWCSHSQQQQQQTLAPTQPASVASFDWTDWGTKKGSIQPSAETSFKMPSFSSSEAQSSYSNSPPEKPDALIASPDNDPYGSVSFGAGIVEQTIKTAIANPPSSVELKVIDAASCSKPRQQPSARFAARLGLARQPLQALSVRSTQPRLPGRTLHTAPPKFRANLPQVDVFRFSSSFSRLAISKKPLRIRVEPSPMLTTAEGTTKSEPVDEISDVQPAVAKASTDPDDEGNSDSPSPVCPVLLNQEYFTKPSLSELQQLAEEELSRVENFVIGRWGCGKITFIGAVDIRGLVLDELVNFSKREVEVYPDDSAKPAIGSELNKPAIVELQGVSAEDNESHEDFLKRLKSHTETMGATFLGYENGGVWSFRVEHF